MLIEKEVIRPGTYWYRDQVTNEPRKLTVTPDLTRYWHDQGNAMLATGLTVPVPFEHDFDAHPMTSADKLKNNAGWVKEYRLKDNRLIGVVDVQDPEVAKKLPGTIRWTSPWINSFMDGNGREWRNVISHLALTTRPRIIDQEPFGDVAAALSMATEVFASGAEPNGRGFDLRGLPKEFMLSNAGLLLPDGLPAYPVAFSLWGGVSLATQNKKIGNDNDFDLDDMGEQDKGGSEDTGNPSGITPTSATPPTPAPPTPLDDPTSDVSMTELLCDLLGALGIKCEHDGNEAMFKRNLYNAAMTEIHNLTGKTQADQEKNDMTQNRTNPPGEPPNTPKPKPGQNTQQNPLIQQEQQPMYMSLEEINALPDLVRGVALAMYNENARIRQELNAHKRVTKSLQDAKIAEATQQRAQRIAVLSKFSPRLKPDLEAMAKQPSMALSMGDSGTVIDPMAPTLAMLEKGLADVPRLLTMEQSALSVQDQPQDADMLSEERVEQLADSMARQMGCPPQTKVG